MVDFTAVTDDDLERARRDPAFRRKLLSDSLELLLVMLNKKRASGGALDKTAAREIRDGVDLAVKLAGLLQTARIEPPKAA
jgi:hypothetical protein